MDKVYIDERREFLTKQYHAAKNLLQVEEQTYYNDTFPVPMIKKPQYVSRTGTGAWLVDGPASSIITRNPQVKLSPKKNTEADRKAANLVNALLNHWVQFIGKQSPQPFKEHVKNLLLYGEAWIHPLYDDYSEKDPEGRLPIRFLTPNPLNIFPSPEEDNGIPFEVCVFYRRAPQNVHRIYPEWGNPKNRKGKRKSDLVEWYEFWTPEERYFEADGVPVLSGGIQENILRLVPFIHSYSGFGNTSPDGDPESLAVGRLRKIKDLLVQECAINSDIDSSIHKFSRPRIDLIVPSGSEFNEQEIKENYDMGAGVFNILSLPPGYSFEEGTRLLPSNEAFQHFYNIRTRIAQEAPPIMAGLPSGTSGRQEDIVGSHFIRRFDSIAEATERAFAKALEMGLKTLKVYPGCLPLTPWLELPDGDKGEKRITEDDIDSITNLQVELKAADPIEDDRKLMAGRALKGDSLIDWETFLVEYAGYTPERAEEIIEQTIADTVVQQNPVLFQALAEKVLENLGMHEQLERLRQENATTEKVQKAAASQPVEQGARGGEARQFNTGSPEAREMIDLVLSQRGVRRPPM